MGLKLSNYINDKNRKLDNETIRKHLTSILYSHVKEDNFLNQVENSKKLYSNQYKYFPSVSLTANHKIKINEVTSDLSYKFSENETQTFNISEELGVA
ncbi:hypothetical protein ACUXE7_000353 [Staphylococcus hominis]